jgi:2-polyprenyl-3-methyl-5-hydroxy-6-metoxy-1,4-benzoquinol methylase
MFSTLKQIVSRPEPFEVYSPKGLWDDEYISKQILGLHLDSNVAMVSRDFKVINRSAAWLASHLNISEKTLIADFGCGPGLYTTRFAEQGAVVTGIDVSRRSIEFARKTAQKKNLNIEYICQNYFDYKTHKKFDLVCMIYCDFCSLSPTLRKIILQKFNALLTKNGVVVLDVYSINQFNQRKEYSNYEYVKKDGFWSEDEYFGFLNIFKYEAEKVVLDKYTLIEKKGTRTFYNWVQFFTKKSLLRCFTENGFKVDSVYADLTGLPYTHDAMEMAVVARKR